MKADDAQIESWIWDERVLKLFSFVPYNKQTTESLNKIRIALLRAWKQRVWKSFFRYLEDEYVKEWQTCEDKKILDFEIQKDINVFIDCAYVTKRTTWFGWPDGSCLLFWRW